VSTDAACGPPIGRSIIPDERILLSADRGCKRKCAVGRRFSSRRAAAAWLLAAGARAFRTDHGARVGGASARSGRDVRPAPRSVVRGARPAPGRGPGRGTPLCVL